MNSKKNYIQYFNSFLKRNTNKKRIYIDLEQNNNNQKSCCNNQSQRQNKAVILTKVINPVLLHKTFIVIIILISLFQKSSAFIQISIGLNTIDNNQTYFMAHMQPSFVWSWTSKGISISNQYNLSTPLFFTASLLNPTDIPQWIVMSKDQTSLAAIAFTNLSIPILFMVHFDNITNQAPRFVRNISFLTGLLPISIQFTDKNNEVIVGFNGLTYNYYTSNFLNLGEITANNLSLTLYTNIVKMNKYINQKLIYFVNQTGGIGIIYMDPNLSNYKNIGQLSVPQTPLLNYTQLFSYDFVFLSTGQLIRFDRNITDGRTYAKIFVINSAGQYIQIGLFIIPSNMIDVKEYDGTLTIIDAQSNLIHFDISGILYGNITEIITIIPPRNGLLAAMPGKFIAAHFINRVLIEPDPITNITRAFTYVFSFTQIGVRNLTLKGYNSCLAQPLNVGCFKCDLSFNALTCIYCVSAYTLDNITNTCIVLPLPSTTSAPSLPQVIERSATSSCPLGMYEDLLTGQCTQIVCSDENCSMCLTNSQICNRCKQGIGVMLIQGKCQVVQMLQTITQTSQSTASPLSVPGLRFYLAPLQPFFACLDDFWYYIYHDRNYSISVKLVFDSIKLINQLKITPQFIDFSVIDDAFNVTKSLLVNDYIAYTPLTYYQQEQKDVQFLVNTHDMYTWNYISGIITFIVFRVIHKILQKCIKTEDGILGTTKQYFMQNSLYKCLFLIFIEGNLIFISFSAALQLREPSQLNFNDKLNMIFAVFYFFIAMMFSSSFYVLVYALSKKEEAEIFLTYTSGGIEGFLCQTSQIGLKNFFSGFIHAYLIFNYQAQILSLIALKIFLSIIVLKFRKRYLNKGIFFSLLAYFTGGFILDIILFCDNQNATDLTPLSLTQIILIGLISFFSVINVCSIFFEPIKQIYMYCKNKSINSVSPQPQLPSKQKSEHVKEKVKFEQIENIDRLSNDSKTIKKKSIKKSQKKEDKQNKDEIQSINLQKKMPDSIRSESPFKIYKDNKNNRKSKDQKNEKQYQQNYKNKVQRQTMPIKKKNAKIKFDRQAKIRKDSEFKFLKQNNVDSYPDKIQKKQSLENRAKN